MSMRLITLPMLLIVVAMLALTACANKRTGTPDAIGHTEGAGGGMGGM